MDNNTGNIFKITKEKDMDKILDKNKQNLVITIFVTSTCDISKQFKIKFIEISKKLNAHYFVYINMNEFENTTYKYTQNIKETPTVVLFTNNKPIAHYKGSCKDTLINFINEITNKIEEAKRELEDAKRFEEHSQKVYILGKLDCIKELGIELSREFNITDNLIDMVKEFNIIKEKYIKIDNISNKTPSNDNNINDINTMNDINDVNSNLNNNPTSINNDIHENESDEKNQRKLAKIKEAENIMKLKQNIELKQLVQLQQLKKIHKLKKEMDDKNNKFKK
jgi:thioredoxin-like negative regulator of GroEL